MNKSVRPRKYSDGNVRWPRRAQRRAVSAQSAVLRRPIYCWWIKRTTRMPEKNEFPNFLTRMVGFISDRPREKAKRANLSVIVRPRTRPR